MDPTITARPPLRQARLVKDADGRNLARIWNNADGTTEVSLGVDAYQTTVLTPEQTQLLIAALRVPT